MAPTRTKKRKSTESTSSVDVQSFPAPPQIVPTKMRSPASTPLNRSPIKKTKMGITVAQKQALIDNLQLEITERARKLRAQYVLQAQGMRTRIEIRVNRIPMALRKSNMGELFSKYSESVPKAQAATSSRERINSPTQNLIQAGQSHSRASPSPKRVPKRLSDEMFVEDKENEDIENPKKRPRQAPNPPIRTTSRKAPPSQVLSPRSANSRTLPRSPVRNAVATPGKSYLARPVSPLKPTAPVPAGGAAGILTNMVEKAKSTRGAAGKRVTDASAGAGRGKRGAAPAAAPRAGRGRASAISDSSESSNSTVVRKPVPPPKKEPAKKTVMGTIRGMGAKKAAPAAKVTPASGTGGRVLRKRN